MTLQPQYNLLVRDIEHEIVPACLDAGSGCCHGRRSRGGWLTGKYKRDETPTGATRLGENPTRGMEACGPRNAQERTWAVIDAVARGRRRSTDVSLAQVALAWLAAQPAVTSVILGARTVEQLGDNLAAAELQLGEDQGERLAAVSAPAAGRLPVRHRGDGATAPGPDRLTGALPLPA